MPEKPEPKGNSLSAVQALLGKSKSKTDNLKSLYYTYVYHFHTPPLTIFDLLDGLIFIGRLKSGGD